MWLPCLIIIISAYFFFRKRQTRQKILQTSSFLQSNFSHNLVLYPSIYQSIILSKNNSIFNLMYTIITLKKDFCLTQLFFTDQTDKLIFKSFLNYKTPNFYINNVRNVNKHFARKYFTITKTKNYTYYGNISQEIVGFCNKYKVDNFYCSYWTEDKNVTEGSVVYLETDIEYLGDEEFINEFFGIFKDIPEESEKRFEKEKKKIMEGIEKDKENEKKDFVERIIEEINKNTNRGNIIKKKKPNKKIK
ncbi:uncharacterized protein VNE69_04065 [Vairimorpha necatrix]|uniref:Membrane protein n=1 Tax=Vairimorpha necatrix TaxID=6039 RepID=A0AAX4JB82_9MICR